MEFFRKLGERVDALWLAQNYDEERFPKVAYQALEELPPHKHTTLLDNVLAATQVSRLPPQNDIGATFGDPPLTVYEGRNFRIEVLFWLRGVPEIHMHGFSGAFHVLEGSSIHTLWKFKAEERIDMRLLLGQVDLTDVEILIKGDNREIISGTRMFHATYHMDRPSLTVVIRTPHEADKSPQYSLTPPHIAYAPFDRQETVVRQAQLLKMLYQTRPHEFSDVVRQLACAKDGYWLYEIMHHVWPLMDDEDLREQFLAAARLRQPLLVEKLQPSLSQFANDDRIVGIRLEIGGDQELRFFLALLRNVPDSTAIRRLVAERYPDRNVIELVDSWLHRLNKTGVLGFELQPAWILAVRYSLEGLSEQQMLAKFEAAGPALSAPRTLPDLRELLSSIRGSWLLRPMLVDTLVRKAA